MYIASGVLPGTSKRTLVVLGHHRLCPLDNNEKKVRKRKKEKREEKKERKKSVLQPCEHVTFHRFVTRTYHCTVTIKMILPYNGRQPCLLHPDPPWLLGPHQYLFGNNLEVPPEEKKKKEEEKKQSTTNKTILI